MNNIYQTPEGESVSLDKVCSELEARGLPGMDAAAFVFADMATRKGVKEDERRMAVDALHQIIMKKTEENNQPPEKLRPRYKGLNKEGLDELRRQLMRYRNALLYYDMVLSSEIQKYAYRVLDRLKTLGLYRHELKKLANTLADETRRLQMRVKDSDRDKTILWSKLIDIREVYARGFYEDGGSILPRLIMAFQREFKNDWLLAELDCKETAKRLNGKDEQLIRDLLIINTLTEIGIRLFDSCVKKTRAIIKNHGKVSINKSMHHESMRNIANNLLEKLLIKKTGSIEYRGTGFQKHLEEWSGRLLKEETLEFFQKEFEDLGQAFVDYMIAWMRIDVLYGKVGIGAIRTVYFRLGTRSRVEKFFEELAAIPLSEDENMDVFDVVDIIQSYKGKKKEIERFQQMCANGERFQLPESMEKQEHRLLRIQARKYKGMLPDDMLRVMALHFKTKTALVKHLEAVGHEVLPTLRRVKKMKAFELKRL